MSHRRSIETQGKEMRNATQCVAQRTRYRRTLSSASDSDARSRPQAAGGGGASPVPPPESVIVLDDEEEEDREESVEFREIKKDVSSKCDLKRGSSEMPVPSQSGLAKGKGEKSQSWSSDRQAVLVGSDSCEGSDGTVECKAGSRSVSFVEKSDSKEVSLEWFIGEREVEAEESHGVGESEEDLEANKECCDGGEKEEDFDAKESHDGEEKEEDFDGESHDGEEKEEDFDGEESHDRHGKGREVSEGREACDLMKPFPSPAPCVARRTRIQVGEKNKVSYTEYFVKQEESDDLEEEKEEEQEESDDLEEEEEDESYRETDNNTEVENSEAANNGGQKSEDFDSLTKTKKFGIDILLSGSNEKVDTEMATTSGSVSQRTRSRFNSMPEEKKKLGTVSNPYCLDEDDADVKFDFGLSSIKREVEMEGEVGIEMDSDGSDIEMDSDGSDEEFEAVRRAKIRKGQRGERNEVGSGSKGGNRMDVDGREEGRGQARYRAGKSKKRKRVQALKANSLFKVLVDTIWNDNNSLPEELFRERSSMEGGSAFCHAELLPLVFSFGDEDPKPIEKSEEEKALDELWADFDFALGANNMGNYHNNEDSEDINLPEDGFDPSTLCPNGKHQFILDEQIGITCKFCSFVELEIKHILPSWASYFGDRLGRKNTVNEQGSSVFNDLSSAGKDDGLHGSYARGTVWDLIPRMENSMYPHQKEAFEFMWKNLAGSIDLSELTSCVGVNETGGCVISHAPGTGKTRLAIVFIQTYMKVFPKCRPVIVAPKGMLHTWKREFRKWDVDLAIHDLNATDYSGEEDDAVLKLVGKEHRDVKWVRLVKLYSWDKGNSVVLISYCLFKMLTVDCTDNDLNGTQLSKILLEKPGLYFFDEGHTARNDTSLIWKALDKVRAPQRVILSGTPFQNNFAELYNTLCLVRPTFASKISVKASKLCERRAEFSDKEEGIFPERNEGKGKWASLTNRIVSDDRKNLEELRSLIKPFVHYHGGNILESLPGLRECVILLAPSPYQNDMLDNLEDVKFSAALGNDYKISLASIHPSLVIYAGLSEKERSFIDNHLLNKLRLDPDEGVKTKFLTELIRLCEALHEKVLVFSQYLKPLEMIRDQLVKLFNWTDGKEVLQLNGGILSKHRQSSIDSFNDFSSDARVLLASTKACCEGISLVGASRVVLLDIVWNPSVERQAISRAYRIGQRKVVYIYRLITCGTGEGDKYIKQAKKYHLSKLVFSPNAVNSFKASSSQAEKERTLNLIGEDKILEEMTQHDKLKVMFSRIDYPLKESDMYAFNEDG